VALERCGRESQRLIARADSEPRQGHASSARWCPRFEIGRVIELEVRSAGFSVIRDLGGHVIGRTIHEGPRVPNFADPTHRAHPYRGLGNHTVETNIAVVPAERS